MKFYFIYKSLAHPELVGNYVQPITLEERLTHAQQAKKQLGATIPWIVDAMDNRLKRALGDRPNSEFIVDPKGKIVRKRAWSFPAETRKDLEELVGKVDRITREEDIKLNIELPKKSPAERGVLQRIQRPKMTVLIMEPQAAKKGEPFYAKLRAEADSDVMESGEGKLYIGFHLDPLHDAHWNNLLTPLQYKITVPDGVKIDKPEGESPKVKVASDADPREFMLNVEGWPEDKPLKLTVIYSACVGEQACHSVKQSYIIHRKWDPSGGAARGVGAGFWEPKQFARQMLAADKDGNGKLDRDEVKGHTRPHFDDFDVNKDGFLDETELKEVARWLNEHHLPGAPEKPKK